MSITESVLAQMEKNKQATSGDKISQEDRLNKFFTTLLPKGSKGEERRIRILPPKNGQDSPFSEVYFHEVQVDGKWLKLYDPAQDGKRSPLNEVYEGLMMSGTASDKELARQYRSRKFYIVKIIDRDNEQHGPKFWRFKYNFKGDGVFDKFGPIWRNKGDISDITKGRDIILTLNLTKSGNGKEYTTITSIIPEDPSPLHKDPKIVKSWLDDELVWSDLYSKKSEEYLEMIAKGEIPRWDSVSGKWISNVVSEENLTSNKQTSSLKVSDPQMDDDADSDLPF